MNKPTVRIDYTQAGDGITLALDLTQREGYPRSRSRVFIANAHLEQLTDADKLAVVKLLTGVYDAPPTANFVEAL